MKLDIPFPPIGTMDVPVTDFLVNGVAVIGLSMLLQQVFIVAGRTSGGRREFARLFTPIAFTTFFIITVIRSSLTLALGLVGALSIVRFRTAIREPEELAYLFIAIAIGIGIGADYFLLTGFAVVLLIFYLLGSSWRVRRQAPRDTMNFRVEGQFTVESLQGCTKDLVHGFRLIRADASMTGSMLLFTGTIANDDMDRLTQLIQQVDPQATLSVHCQI